MPRLPSPWETLLVAAFLLTFAAFVWASASADPETGHVSPRALLTILAGSALGALALNRLQP